MHKTATTPKPVSQRWNIVGYLAFTIAGLLFTVWGSDSTQGPMFMALALIFDPYDQSVKWGDRPWWVRAWLLVHCIVAIVAFVHMFLT